jgi:protein-disulfide isomerase
MNEIRTSSLTYHIGKHQCSANQKPLEDIQDVRDFAYKKLEVASTPTFFVNGKNRVGDVSVDVKAWHQRLMHI